MPRTPASSPSHRQPRPPARAHQGPLPGGACSSSWPRSAPSAAPSACRTPSGVSSWPPSAPNTAASSPFRSRNVWGVLAGCWMKLRQGGGQAGSMRRLGAAARLPQPATHNPRPELLLPLAPKRAPRSAPAACTCSNSRGMCSTRPPARPGGRGVLQHAVEHAHQRHAHRLLHAARRGRQGGGRQPAGSEVRRGEESAGCSGLPCATAA